MTLIADITIPEWLASVLAGAAFTTSMAVTGYLAKRIADLRDAIVSLEKRMQHLEDRLGTNPPFLK